MSKDKQVTILLVDPDIDYLDWATKHLETDTVQILRCNAADKAVQVIRKVDVQLMIADFGLQPFDGIELVRQVRTESPSTLVCMTASFTCTSQVVVTVSKYCTENVGTDSSNIYITRNIRVSCINFT